MYQMQRSDIFNLPGWRKKYNFSFKLTCLERMIEISDKKKISIRNVVLLKKYISSRRIGKYQTNSALSQAIYKMTWVIPYLELQNLNDFLHGT